ncbi:MAG: hypothetical protein KGY38_05555 [Desulfobacterales bacterium]|nr:hypothetical protein [Desulfobacterales bacterium]
MIIIPREKPVVQDLNSYYLDIQKLIEHYQGELGAGAVYFKSPVSEAVVFFDEQNLVNGYFEDRNQSLQGRDAIDRIMETAAVNNFTVSVFRILPERLYFWANLQNSKMIYKDLTSEFTDLEGLIKKMEAESLTGFIDVELSNGEGGLLFIYKGKVIGGSSADGAGNVDRSREYRDDLIRRSKEYGGKFNVSRVLLDEDTGAGARQTPEGPAQAVEERKAGGRREQAFEPAQISRQRVLEMLQMLLASLETMVRGNRKVRSDFETLLNKKFIEKIDKYEFLDPFAADFKYSGGKVSYSGYADWDEVVGAIEECVYEIAQTHGLLSRLRSQLDDWRSEFADEIARFNVRL